MAARVEINSPGSGRHSGVRTPELGGSVMSLLCSEGHATRGKLTNVYVSIVDDSEAEKRGRLALCREHYAPWLSKLAGRTEFNGESTRGPFVDRKCHWGNHDLDGPLSDAALFILTFPGGNAREAYRALLCEDHLGQAVTELGLGGL
jgi:hypothetical protein